MLKILLIICLSIPTLFAQEIKFSSGKKISLKQLKKHFKVHEVEIFNYHINKLETYYAFSFNEIMNNAYPYNWKRQAYVKIKAIDNYTAFIDTYKFRFRVPYLAFKKKYSANFTTVFDYGKVLNLDPFFLIWKEDYKGGAAKRTDHWIYGIETVDVIKRLPLRIMPEKEASDEILYGYDNYVKQCIACHALDGIGGSKSFNLLTEEVLAKDDKYLMRFISHPKYFKRGTKKPPFPSQISKRSTRIKLIVKFVRYISQRDFNSFEETLPKGKMREKLYLDIKTRIDNLE